MHATPRLLAHPAALPVTARRASPAVYRRRRLTAAVVAVVATAALAAVVDTAAGGTAGRAVFERVIAVAVVVVWVRCAVALWRWHRVDDAASVWSDAESGVSCLSPDSASKLSPPQAA